MRVFVLLLVGLVAVGLVVGGCGNGDNGVSDPGDGDDNDNPPPDGPEGMTATITGGEETIDFHLDNEYSIGTFDKPISGFATVVALWANGEESAPDYHTIGISFSVPEATSAPAVLPLTEAPTGSPYALFHYFENVREGEEILFGGVGPGIGTFEGTLNLSYLSDTSMAGTFNVTCEIGGDFSGTRTIGDGDFYITTPD
jgi:hypothetical protein